VKFTEIPGLHSLKKKLIDSVRSQHIAHAQLFLGKPGALNLPLALAYTAYLHCENKGADACGVCAACSKSFKYIHPDTNFVFPVGNLKSDSDEERQKADILKAFRAFLIEQPFGDLDDWINFYGGEDKLAIISKETSREIIRTLTLKPFESKFKVMIIWQPELMHPSAANGILKILEEPPPNTIFLLVSNSSDKLLPTILSRTQVIQVPYLTDEEIDPFLKEKKNMSDEAQRQQIVQLADGNLTLALKLADSEENHYEERFIEWMRSCYKKDYPKLVAFADEFHELDKLGQRNMFGYSLTMIRETLVQTAGANQLARLPANKTTFVRDFSKVMNVYKLEKLHQLITDAAFFLERNGSAKMIFLDLSLQISKNINP
jgi:DNA polymerase-3 subunit delta'